MKQSLVLNKLKHFLDLQYLLRQKEYLAILENEY
jgi:hypothetical protein